MTTPAHRPFRSALLALSLVAGVTATAAEAFACGGGWWSGPTEFGEPVDLRIDLVAQAEQDLAAGKYQAAAVRVLRDMSYVRGLDKLTLDPLNNRSMRVLAVAFARSGGQLGAAAARLPASVRSKYAGDSSEARQANLEWSVKALKALRKHKKDDVTLKTELAEAMAQVPAKQANAKKMLESLARKDLLTSPEGYRALGHLRGLAGDADGKENALQRCRNMARDAATCDLPGNDGES